MATLGSDAKLIYAEDANGHIGKKPEPEFSISADLYLFALTYGQRRK